MDSFLGFDNEFELCIYVYKHRHPSLISKLAMRAQEEEDRAGPQSKRSSFASVKHYLGRLAHHVWAPQELVKDAFDLSHLLESYEVCAVEPIPPVLPPVPDNHTTLDGILNRMLSNDSKRRETDKSERQKIENTLLYMNTQSRIFERFMDQYNLCTPQVHAEVQVLEYFYKMKLSFVGDDRYIACSKPACLCCKMYFRYHPARMVVPETHSKIWVNWGPPLVQQYSKKNPESKQQLDILNEMIKEIRRQAIDQILGQVSPSRWHPDSRTGITENQRSEFSSSNFSDISSGYFSDNDRDDVEVTPSTGEQVVSNNSLLTIEMPNQAKGIEFLDGDSDSDTGGISIYA